MKSRSPWISTLFLTLFAFALPMTASEPAEEPNSETPSPVWSAFELDELSTQRQESGRAYLPFLRVPSLWSGLYEIAAGGEDRQRPHDRDEIYYVIKGKAHFQVDDQEMTVGPGTILYVAAHAEHRFHTITEDLSVLVVFAGKTP